MTPGQQMADGAARERIRTSLDESLLVEAAAGAGKTSELVRRIVAVLRGGRTTIDRIAAVTFTRKAAGELKLRLRQELDTARTASGDAAQREHLERAVAHLEEARIGTIHSFCADILRERPVEARIDPAFRELDETEAPRLYRRVFRRWLQEQLDRESPGLQRALSRMAAREWDERTPAEQLEDAGWKLIEWRDFEGRWRREAFDRESQIDALVTAVARMAEMASMCTRAGDLLKRSLEPAIGLATWVERAESVRARDYDALEGLLAKLLGDLKRDFRKGGGFFGPMLPREEVLRERDRLLGQLEQFKTRADADLAAALQGELGSLIPAYNRMKARAGAVDFMDLLLCARNLVRDNREVREYLQRRFSHLFIDEFQDTDPLQAEILILLSADRAEGDDWRDVTPAPGKLFAVGDPKQSVYRFRRADVILYREVVESLTQRGVGRIHLTTSFRATPAIQRLVNAAFAPEMNGDTVTGQPDYVPLTEFSPEIEGQPALVALAVPKPYGKTRVTQGAIEASLPGAVAAYVDWLVRQSGWQVRDPDDRGRLVPLGARHVCILFRRFMSYGTDITRAYTRALEARGLPHLLVGGRSFHRREEVETMRAALSAIEWPEDELSVFATLKGSLFAISDAVLLRYRGEAGVLHPFRAVPDPLDPELEPAAEALRLLKDLHRQRNRQPLAATVNELLEATRAHAGFALRPGGNQILANVYRVCDLARSFELGGGLSFRGFVEELNEQAERDESAEAPVLEEGADGVRIMTVHTAKGLEFPVVILADITAKLQAGEPDRHVDAARNVSAVKLLGCSPWDLLDHQAEEKLRDEAEGVRIAYVAATRARDLLVVPGVADGAFSGWLGPLNKALYPAPERVRHSRKAPHCPPFGNDAVVARHPDFLDGLDESVKPGLHTMDGYSVVWWDPNSLDLGTEEFFGLRHEEVLAEDAGGAVARESERRHEEWKERGRRITAQGSEPRFTLLLATEAEEPPPQPAPVEMAEVARAGDRPGGRRFGALVHGVLRDTPLDAKHETVAALAGRQARLTGSSAEEVEAALAAVTAALAHPLLRRAAAAEDCRREWPLTLKLDGGRILEGVIDLAFLDHGAWTIVDFKTDAAESMERYRAQVSWYVHAVTTITGLPARGWLLRV